MSLWNTRVVGWVSDRLVTLSNYVWRKRKAAENEALKKRAPFDPPHYKRR